MNSGRRFLAALALTATVLFSGCGEQATVPATGTIYGDLFLEDGTAAAGVRVYVEETGASALADDEGRFIIDGLLAVDEDGIGKYYTVLGLGKERGTDIGFLRERVKVKGSQSYGLGDVMVPPTGSIEGRLNLDGSDDNSGARIRIAGTTMEAITRADGSFMIHRVPAHSGYRIHCMMTGYEDQILDNMGGMGDPIPIEVESGVLLDLGETVLETRP